MRGTRLNAAQNRREDLMYEQVMRDVTKTLRACPRAARRTRLVLVVFAATCSPCPGFES